MRLSFRHDIKLLSFQINTIQPVEQTSDDGPDDVGGGMIAAITISCIGAACLLLLAVLWVSTFFRYIRTCVHRTQQCSYIL
jgi:hypothetical protein